MSFFDRIFGQISRPTEWTTLGQKKTAHASVKVPDVLPSVEQTMVDIDATINAPQERLCGLTPLSLFRPWFDVSRSWFVGSIVWRHCIGEAPFPDHDFDVVFADADIVEDFIVKAHQTLLLTRRDGRQLSITRNKFGSPRIVQLLPESCESVIIDAWALPHGQSIAEHVSGYPWIHQRCAYMVGSMVGDISGLTRLIRPATFDSRLSGD